MNVKAQGLLNAAAWVRAVHDDAALERVLARCSPTVRDRVATAIAINWIPFEELAEILGACDRVLGAGDGRTAEEIGLWSAKKNLGSLGLRLAFFLLNPAFLMRRTAGVWGQYNNEGKMNVLGIEDGLWRNELVGCTVHDWFVCCSVTGWLREAARATVDRKTTGTHAECMARGAKRCVWEIRWPPGAAKRG